MVSLHNTMLHKPLYLLSSLPRFFHLKHLIFHTIVSKESRSKSLQPKSFQPQSLQSDSAVMARNFLAGDLLAHAVTFGDFMAKNFLAGDFLGGYRFGHVATHSSNGQSVRKYSGYLYVPRSSYPNPSTPISRFFSSERVIGFNMSVWSEKLSLVNE